GFDGGGGVVAGVVHGAREPADVTAVADDVGADDRANPVEGGERGPGCGDGVSDAFDVGGELAIDAPDLGEEVTGQRFALGVDRRRGVNRGEDAGGAVCPERRGRWPAIRKPTVVCSGHIACVRASMRSWWRLASRRSTAVWSSAPTWRRRWLRRA